MTLRLTKRGLWAFGQTLPNTIGRSGLTATKCEGDGATPIGRHLIVDCLYRADRIARPNAWATAIGPRDLWSDDGADPDYNHRVTAPHGYGHEHLRRADPMYDLVLVLDWNWPNAVPGRGSAIFVHQWRRPGAPTAGCIALGRADLQWLAQRVSPGMVLAVGTGSQLR